jgi:hypothetical protein
MTIPVGSGATQAERLGEAAEILAAGLIRMRAQMSSQKSADFREIPLDCNAQRSGPEPNSPGEVKP